MSGQEPTTSTLTGSFGMPDLVMSDRLQLVGPSKTLARVSHDGAIEIPASRDELVKFAENVPHASGMAYLAIRILDLESELAARKEQP